MTAQSTDSVADRVAKLKADKAERERKSDAERAAFELQGLELEAKYSAEIGEKGIDFDIVDLTSKKAGFVVVKLGEDLSFRKYVDATMSSDGVADLADCDAFVTPCVVHPSVDEYRTIVRKHGFFANKCAEALAGLHGVEKGKTQGK